jgi:hypothetical protein
MIITLESIRIDRIQAIRALRVLHYLPPEQEERCQNLDPIMPGVREARDMLDRMPFQVWILPEDLPEFEKYFFLQVKPEPSPFDPFGGICAHIRYPHGEIAVKGDAKDIADTIYRLLAEGHSRESIYVYTPGPYAC